MCVRTERVACSPRRSGAGGVVAAVLLAAAVAEPLAAEAVPIHGSVVAAEGGELADARVTLEPLRPAFQVSADWLDGRLEAEPAAAVEVGSDGRFVVEAPAAGMWRLRVTAPGRLPMEADLTPLVESTTLPEIGLRPAEEVEVTVVGPKGVPVSGALILARDVGPSPWRLWRREGTVRIRPATRRAVADTAGRAVVARAVDEPLDLSAAAAGFLTAESSSVRDASLRLELAPGWPIELRVVDSRGASVPGALVRTGDDGWPVGRTDEAGRLRLTAPESGHLAFSVVDAEGRGAKGRVSEADASAPVEIELRRPRRVTGRVIDRESRQPLAGAVVWDPADPAGAVVVDAAGGFSLAVSEGARASLGAARAGYFAEWGAIEPGSDPVHTFALRPAAVVAGTVVDAEGAPVANALVTAVEAPVPGRRIYRVGRPAARPRSRTDAQGRFVLAGLEPDKPYRVTARRHGFAPGSVEVPPLAARVAASDLRIELGPGTAVAGRVVDAGGAPVPGVRVVLRRSVSDRRVFFSGTPDEAAAEATADADGRFELEHLPPALFDLEVEAPRFAPTTMPGLEVGAGPLDLGEIVLEPGAAIEGRVVDADGQPVEGAEVRAEAPDPMASMRARFGGGGEPETVSAADGFFSVADRRPGERVDLLVRRDGYAAATVPGVEVPPAEPVVVTLTPASSLSGRVIDGDGEPIEGATIEASVEGGGATGGGTVFMMATAGFAMSGPQGEFTLTGLEPGTLRLRVGARGFRQVDLANVRIPEGEDVDGLEIELATGATVAGRVTDPAGRPVARARVRVVERQGSRTSRYASAETDGDGRFQLSSVEPGPRLVAAEHPELGTVRREIEVFEGANRLDLEFEGGTEVAGRVVDETGGPIGGASVWLSSAGPFDRGGREESTGPDGAFRFTGTREGSYRLRAARDGYAEASSEERIEVSGAPVEGVELVLVAGGSIVGRVIGLDPAELGGLEIFAASDGAFTPGAVRHDGSYRVDHLAPGDWRVWATSGSRRADGRATVEPGVPETVLDLEFGGGLRVSGVVLRGTEPLAGASVYLAGEDVSGYGSAVTDRDGRFAIEGLAPGRYRLQVSDFSTGLQHSEPHRIADDLDLVVEIAASRVAGRVVDGASGEPIAGAVVRLEPDVPADQLGRMLERAGSTDSGGGFQVSDVAAGAYRAVAEKEGYAPASHRLVIEPGREVDDLEIALAATEGLIFEVRLPSGAPASRVSVEVRGLDGTAVVRGVFTADQDGTVRLATVPTGSWSVLLAADGCAATEVEAAVPGRGGRVVLAPEARLEVQIPELEGDPSIVKVEAFGEDGRPATIFSWGGRTRTFWRLSHGRGRLTGLAPGAWRVRAAAPDGRVWEGRARLAAGTNPPLVLD